MPQPERFSWIDRPLLAAMARPDGPEDLAWLRKQGVELLVSLTEERLRRDWVDDAGLLVFHEPMEDMEAPSQEALGRVISAIRRANERNMGVAIHCGAGLGRTGVVLACYFVTKGLTAQNAIGRVRRLRPGSVETDEQADAVEEFARRWAAR
ncbi:MAG TPA: dual specificity protein phosphatase family protein [Gemmataceae bacterium]|nr:dual specificity protein phosphatase family protein [Gemmataceae bacterium]